MFYYQCNYFCKLGTQKDEFFSASFDGGTPYSAQDLLQGLLLAGLGVPWQMGYEGSNLSWLCSQGKCIPCCTIALAPQ